MENSDQSLIIPISNINPEATLPERAHSSDAGHDLFSLGDCRLKPLERKLVKTGIRMAIPEGYYGRIAPRSGLALEKGIDVMAGVIDSSYRGEIGVILVNLSDSQVELKAKSKIAQLIIERYWGAEWYVTEDLDDTKRGEGGFGSTDIVQEQSLSNKRPVNLGNCLGKNGN